jgi:very-short-patch-repair endonuclease
MDKSTLRQRARDLRKNSTDAERQLWYYLRANRLGFKFKRQVPIGAYIVDFACLEKRLIIELDGWIFMPRPG